LAFHDGCEKLWDKYRDREREIYVNTQPGWIARTDGRDKNNVAAPEAV
jgi:hypothetical protein